MSDECDDNLITLYLPLCTLRTVAALHRGCNNGTSIGNAEIEKCIFTMARHLIRPNIGCGCATARCNNWTADEMNRTAVYVDGATLSVFLPGYGVTVGIFFLVVNLFLDANNLNCGVF